MHVPWAASVLSGLAGMYARLRPDARATLTDFPLIPPSLRAPVSATNEGALGYAFDRTTSPAALSLIQVRAGRLAATGDPRPWQDGEVTPIQRLARLFGRSPVDATEWYFPTRLSLDVDGASGLGRSDGHEAARPARVPPPLDQAAALRAPDRPHRRARAARRAAADRVVADPGAGARSSSTRRPRTATSTR